MTDTAKRLSGPQFLTTSAVTQYTVPGATSTVVRNIHVCNETGTAATFTLSIGTDGAGKRSWDALPIAANGSFDWSGFLPMATGEVIQALAGTGSALTLWIGGVESS